MGKQGAVKHVIDRHIALFAQMEDDYLRERVADLKDLGRRILASLQEADSSHRELSADSIPALVKRSVPLLWLNSLSIRSQRLSLMEGAANSHMVIVARALGIPTVVVV